MKIHKETIKLFWRRAWQHKPYVIGLMIITPIAIFLHSFMPSLIIANVLDRLSRGDFIAQDPFGSFGTTIIFYALVTLIGDAVGWRVLIWCIWKLEAAVSRDIAKECFHHLMKLDAAFHANHFGGSLVTQASKLISAYVRTADTTVFTVSGLVFSFLFTCIILLPKAPIFVGILFGCALIYVWVAAATARRIRYFNTREAVAQSKQTGYLADSISNIMAVKSFSNNQDEQRRFANATDATFDATQNLMKATVRREAYFSTISQVIKILALTMAIISVVMWRADIATVFLILSCTMDLLKRLWDFNTNGLRHYNRAFGDAHDMIEILHTQPRVQDPVKANSARIIKGAITFNDVGFTHADAGADDTLFSHLNLRVASGEKIGLVGHSGSGKTTLTKLLLRFTDIDEGKIKIDGQDIALLRQDDLRKHIAYVPQEPLLFHRSIKENISYGTPNASDDDIKRAAKKAAAAEFIERLPNGYNTLVGERGVKLSGGQRQRIAIARAILKDAPILVLDEATSALDSESEKAIQQALWELMKNRTAIVIAHRLSTIQKMDRIVVLENGTIIEEGTHAKLLEQKGTYASLWSHQSGGFLDE